MSRNTVRRNFSVTKEADRVLDEKSDEWDISRSEIVSKAVLEYTNEDRLSRIEGKVDEIGYMLSKEKASEDDSAVSEDDPTSRDRVFNVIERECDGVPRGDRDGLPSEADIMKMCSDELGMNPEDVKQDIAELKRIGKVYRPKQGRITTI